MSEYQSDCERCPKCKSDDVQEEFDDDDDGREFVTYLCRMCGHSETSYTMNVEDWE